MIFRFSGIIETSIINAYPFLISERIYICFRSDYRKLLVSSASKKKNSSKIALPLSEQCTGSIVIFCQWSPLGIKCHTSINTFGRQSSLDHMQHFFLFMVFRTSESLVIPSEYCSSEFYQEFLENPETKNKAFEKNHFQRQ